MFILTAPNPNRPLPLQVYTQIFADKHSVNDSISFYLLPHIDSQIEPIYSRISIEMIAHIQSEYLQYKTSYKQQQFITIPIQFHFIFVLFELLFILLICPIFMLYVKKIC